MPAKKQTPSPTGKGKEKDPDRLPDTTGQLRMIDLAPPGYVSAFIQAAQKEQISNPITAYRVVGGDRVELYFQGLPPKVIKLASGKFEEQDPLP